MLKILVEGKNDKSFIEDFIESRLRKKKDTDFEVRAIGGWHKLKKSETVIKGFNDEEYHVQVIFDADGDYQTRRRDIEAFKEDSQINFELFLFPDNKSSGELETLLEQIVNDKHRRVLKCFQKYEDCLKRNNEYGTTYATLTGKSKTYAYIEAFSKTGKQKEKLKRGDFFYRDPEIWNLHSEKLDPLIAFIKKGITP